MLRVRLFPEVIAGVSGIIEASPSHGVPDQRCPALEASPRGQVLVGAAGLVERGQDGGSRAQQSGALLLDPDKQNRVCGVLPLLRTLLPGPKADARHA